ncbi:MAG: hypothetical protein ACFFCS_06765 [Candidatus Hodarchaeota archaeon]
MKEKQQPFIPDRAFMVQLASYCLDYFKRNKSKNDIIESIQQQQKFKKVRGKLIKYFHSIMKYKNLLEFFLGKIDPGVSLINDEDTLEHLISLGKIFHYWEPFIERGKESHPSKGMQDVENVKLSKSNPIIPLSWSEFDERVKNMQVKGLFNQMDDISTLSLKYAHPTFFVKKMLELVTRDRLERILAAHRDDDVFFLAAGTTRHFQEMKQFLAGKGFSFQEDRFFQNLLQVRNIPGWKSAVLDLELVKESRVLIQDRGSIAIIEALDIEPGDVILDACAAPFQKTIGVPWRCGSKGRIFAVDRHGSRILPNLPRMKPKSFANIYPVNADSSRISKLFRDFEPNKILLDVPCTGSGSLISFPELKLQQNREFLERNVVIQKKILRSVLDFTRINEWERTEIVYSTCSYYPREGEAIIDEILEEIIIMDLHDPQSSSPGVVSLPFGWKGYQCSRKVARTFPDDGSGSKGFFIAKFKSRT